MKKYVFLFAALVVLGVGYRIVRAPSCLFGPTVLGVARLKSPDGHFTAFAMNTYEDYFWGGDRRFYEFVIEDQSQQRIRLLRVDTPPQEPVEWRLGEGSILWAADNSAVTYTFKSTKLTLSLLP